MDYTKEIINDTINLTNINKKILLKHWKKYDKSANIITFYGENNLFGEFSNFKKHKEVIYIIPTECGLFSETTIQFEFGEKAIMLCKASLFNDIDIFNKIKHCSTPLECKKLGRLVKNYDENLWDKKRYQIIYTILLAKFTQIEEFKQKLIDTENTILIEASPLDKIWGVGLSKTSTNIDTPAKWPGANLLGVALMKTRYVLL
jgi:ribA/ribD-fused uncharacterized protein